jgi:DNA-binding HxlR family transcriptional regulator
MQRKSFAGMACPIARSLEHIGEWWSMLILRDAFAGKTRFDEFQSSLGIAPNMLARRLSALVDAGMLQRQPYQQHPPRHEYLLTARGRDFHTVLITLLAFGHRHFAANAAGTRIVDLRNGATVEPALVDRRSGEPLDAPHYAIVRGKAPLGAAKAPRTGLLAAAARRSAEAAPA